MEKEMGSEKRGMGEVRWRMNREELGDKARPRAPLPHAKKKKKGLRTIGKTTDDTKRSALEQKEYLRGRGCWERRSP